MLRVSRRVFRRVAQQLFRNHTRLLEFCLRLRLIAFEEMNRFLRGKPSAQARSCQVINVSPGNFCTTARASGNLRCNIRTQDRFQGHQTIRIDIRLESKKIVFRLR